MVILSKGVDVREGSDTSKVPYVVTSLECVK